MNVIVGMKEIKTPFKFIRLRFFKAYDGNFFVKFGKRPRRKLSFYQQTKVYKKIAN